MKKTLSLVLVGLMGFMVLPSVVGAEAIKVGERVHSIIEVEYPDECSNVENSYLEMIGVDKLIYREEGNGKLYIGQEDGTCRAATSKEYIEYWNIPYVNSDNFAVEEDNKYYIIEYKHYNYENGPYIFLPTTDTELVEGKQYYDESEEPVLEPSEDNLDELFEMYFYIRPMEYKIDTNIKYFTHNSTTGEFDLVASPVLADMNNYYILQSQYDYYNRNIVSHEYTREEYFDLMEDIGEAEDETEFDVTEAEIVNIHGKKYIQWNIRFGDSYDKYYWTDTDLNLIPLFNEKEFYWLGELSNRVIYSVRFVGEDEIPIFELWDKEFNLIKNFGELDKEPYVYYSGVPYMGLASLALISEDEVSQYKTYLVYTHELLDGKDQTYSDEDLLFRFSGLLSKVKKVLVNGEEVAEENVTLTSGSTIVTLKKAYLDTLAKGTYTLEVEYEDGAKPTTTFKVNEKPAPAPTPTTDTTPNPDTVDNIGAYLALGLMSTLGLLGTGLYIKKRHN